MFKLKILSGKYYDRYGGADYFLEFEDGFSYQDFKHLKGRELPEKFCVTSYCNVPSYSHVFTIYINRSGEETLYCLVNSYDIDKWKEDYHLEKFCLNLWESFKAVGFKTGNKPKLEEYSYYIPITVAVSSEMKIQDAVESTCKKISEIHDSFIMQIRKRDLKIKMQPSLHSQTVFQNNKDKLKIVDGFEITKYKGKFFEIDIPKIAKKIISRKKI